MTMAAERELVVIGTGSFGRETIESVRMLNSASHLNDEPARHECNCRRSELGAEMRADPPGFRKHPHRTLTVVASLRLIAVRVSRGVR